MINRLLIRIKTIQLVYACLQSGQPRAYVDEKYTEALDASHLLYDYLLALIVKVTDYRRSQIETARKKFMPTAEEQRPNLRFVDNQVATLVAQCSSAIDNCEKEGLTSDFDTELYRELFNMIADSEAYQRYMSQPSEPTFDEQRQLWVEILNTIFPNCTKLDEVMEERNVYWNDDLTTILKCVVKSIEKLKPDTDLIDGGKTFNNKQDRQFALDLFHYSLDGFDEQMQLIAKVTPNWEADRMALMDRVIMCCALAEIRHFNDIAVAISINEYLELAKHYCSRNSASFINGVIDKIVKQWRADGVIFKV